MSWSRRRFIMAPRYLAGRIALSAAALTLVLLTTGGVASYFAFLHMIQGQISGHLDFVAERSIERVEDRINLVVRDVVQLAEHSMIANALADPVTRDAYVNPFLLERQRQSLASVPVVLADFQGKVIAGDEVLGAELWPVRSWLTRVVAEGKPQALPFPSAERLLLAAPVVYPATGTTEGVVVADIAIPVLVGQAIRSGGPRILLTDPDQGEENSLLPRGQEWLWVSRDIALASPLDKVHLHLLVAEPREAMMAPLRTLYAIYAVLAVLTLLAVGFFFTALGRRLAAPLERQVAERTADLRREITERRTTQVALLASQKNLHDMAAALPGMVFQFFHKTDGTHGLSFVSPGCETLFGFSPEQALADPTILHATVHPDDGAAYLENITQTMAAGTDWINECRARSASGEYRWYRSMARPAPDGEGGMVYNGFTFDITTGKQSERLLYLLNWLQTEFIARADVHTLFRGLLTELVGLTSSAYGFIAELRHDPETAAPLLQPVAVTDISWDEKSRKMISLSHLGELVFANMDTLFGAVVRTLAPVVSNNPDTDARRGTEKLPEGHPPLTSFLGLPFLAGDRMVGMLALASRPQGYDQEIVTLLKPLTSTCGVILAARDTESQRVQAIQDLEAARISLQRQAQDLARSNAELEAFAYVASHDMRQPLRMVTSYLSLLERGLKGKLEEEEQEYLAFARDGARRLDRLIVDLLDYSRIGRRQRELEHLPLDEVVDEAVLNLAAAIQDANAEIIRAGPLPVLRGERGEMVRLFQNLIGNGIKYRATERPCQVVIRAETSEKEWVVSVRDTGIGISPEFYQRIFGIFQRLHTADQYEGTGIGLAVCRKVVEHHQGRIWVDSTSGVGSTFFVALPEANVGA